MSAALLADIRRLAVERDHLERQRLRALAVVEAVLAMLADRPEQQVTE